MGEFSIVLKFGNIKIGIFGIISDAYSMTSLTKDSVLTIENPEETARKIVNELNDKCDLVIALSHLGYKRSKALAEKINGIDLLISGHLSFRHKELININKTLIVQTKYQGQYIGDLLLSLNNTIR